MKRVLAVLLALCLLVGVLTVSASALISQENGESDMYVADSGAKSAGYNIDPNTGRQYAPKNVTWGTAYYEMLSAGKVTQVAVPQAGSMCWEMEVPGEYYFEIKLYSKESDAKICDYAWHTSGRLFDQQTEIGVGGIGTRFSDSFFIYGTGSTYHEYNFDNLEDGEYYYTIRTVDESHNPNETLPTDSEIVVSDTWTYRKPSKALPAIPKSNLKWDKGYIVFEGLTNSDDVIGYKVEVYFGTEVTSSSFISSPNIAAEPNLWSAGFTEVKLF